MSYVVLGHATEHLLERKTIPPGCMLILAEECGVLGTFPHTLYSIFSDPANAALFNDPVVNKGLLERLFKKPFAIYKAGEEYPNISYTLLSYAKNAEEYDTEAYDLEPSGVYSLPASQKDWILRQEKKGFKRHSLRLTKKDDISRVFQGAVFPTVPSMSLGSALDSGSGSSSDSLFKTNQASLFSAFPGIYFNFLCRDLSDEDAEIERILKEHFPDAHIFKDNAFNRFAVIREWLQRREGRDKSKQYSAEQRAGLARIRLILDTVYERRLASAERRGHALASDIDTIVGLLSASVLSGQVKKMLRDLPDASLNFVDSHNGYTSLMAAAAAGHLAIVRYLIGRGADLNVADYDGVTALMLACSVPHAGVAGALLLEGGVLPSAAADDGVTALHIAASDASLSRICRLILEKGGDPNAGDEDGDTPVMLAATHGMLTNLRLLVGFGGNVDLQNSLGYTALTGAIREGQEACAAYLVTRSNLELRTNDGKTSLGLALKAGFAFQDIFIKMVMLGCPVSNWKAVLDYAKKNKLAKIVGIAETITGAPGFSSSAFVNETAEVRKKMVRCLLNGREWISSSNGTRRCLKPCLHGRTKTLRCKQKKKEKAKKDIS